MTTRNHDITDVFDAGNWSTVTKPYICEYPTILDKEFFRYTRAFRVDPTRKTMKERGMSRAAEEKESGDSVEIWTQALTYLALDQLLAQIRSIIVLQTGNTTYTSLWIEGEADIASQKDRFFSKFIIKGYKTGKVRSVPT